MSMMYVRNLVDLHLKYYTDHHDVDEETRTIAHCGNFWARESHAGIAHRDLYYFSTSVGNGDVAYQYNKNSTLITGVEF